MHSLGNLCLQSMQGFAFILLIPSRFEFLCEWALRFTLSCLHGPLSHIVLR